MPRFKASSHASLSRGVVITYTSLFLLLLTFFILLNSMGRVEETRLQAALQSLQGSFGLQAGGQRGSGMLPVLTPVEQDYHYLRGLTEGEHQSGGIMMLRSHGQRTMAVGQALLFEDEGAELSPQGREFLARVALVVKDRGYPLVIAGHLDPDQAAGGQGAEALTQSGRRALAVLRLLVQQGVDPSRLTAQGVAAGQPLLPVSHPQHRRYNNRVELVLDAREASPSLLPQDPQAPKAEFRGFVFDLMPEKER